MNQEIRDTLAWRAEILHNSEKLVKFGSKANTTQLSLFGDSREQITMEKPSDVNYELMIEKEKEVLGVNLLYNIFDRYVLVSRRFCNHTIRTINEITSQSQKVFFLGQVTDIEYRKSTTGNNYAKVFFRDNDSTIKVYLFGEMYRRYISSVYKERIYLVEADFNAEKGSINIVNMKQADEIEPEKFISTVTIHLNDFRSALNVKAYIDNNMFGSRYELYFTYDGERFRAPFKINFSEENYLFLKDKINDITVDK
jgi:DNA polymerase III alpha subunit